MCGKSGGSVVIGGSYFNPLSSCQLLEIFLWISSGKKTRTETCLHAGAMTFVGRLVVDAVAVAGGLAGDDDADWGGAPVHGLMRLTGGDLDSLSCLEGEVVMLDFHGEFALEDVEELAGARVVMAGFAGAGGH